MRIAGLVLCVLLTTGQSHGGTAAEALKPPQGFRFRNGQMLHWGASKHDLMEMLPPQSLGARIEPTRMVVYCTGDPITQENSDKAKLVENAGGDGCVVADRAMPLRYLDGVFGFNRDRFYLVFARVQASDVGEVKHSLIQALGSPRNEIGEPEEERWDVGPVMVVLGKLYMSYFFSMRYAPLVVGVKRPQATLTPDPKSVPF